jgi:hypothetical protein
MSAIALFVSLGGVGYAAATIGSAQIKNNSVASRDIKDGTIASKDMSKKTIAALKSKKGDPGPTGATGATGAKGADGATGAQGSPGPTASSAASANPEPDTAINPIGLSDVLSTTVTTTTSSRVIGNASVQVEPALNTPTVACQIKIDGTFVGESEQASVPGSPSSVVISLSQGAVVPAGSHVVALACQQTAPAAGAVFAQGNITAIATAA